MSTYLLVHGAWCSGWVWNDLTRVLEERGHQVVVVERLPSTGVSMPASGGLTADAAYVRMLLERIEDDVVLVGHSYGGMVISELADHSAVSHTVYVAAFWPQRGQSLMDLLGDGPLPAWVFAPDSDNLKVTGDVEVARTALCADLDSGRATELHRNLVLQSACAFTLQSKVPARTHPTTYIVAEQDLAIPRGLQEEMAEQADTVWRIAAAHMVQISQAEELAKILHQLAPS